MNHSSITTSINTIPTKTESKRVRRRSIIREFCLNTSTHALPSIARSESIHNRLFWLFSFISFMGIMIYFIVTAILNYFSYPTNIDVSYDGNVQQYFAAFSFCNIAPLRLDKFIRPFLNYTNSLNWTNTNDTTTISPLQASLIWRFLVYKSNQRESLEPYFFSLSSILYECSYNFKPCSAADFISFTSATHGLCYTFNAKLKNSTNENIRYGNFYGGSGVLSLGLYIHSHQYVPYTVDAAGVIALIHDNTQVPLIETSGAELAPGRRHRMSYRKKRVDFLSSPYTQCTNKLSASMEAMLINYNGADYAYSQSICYQVCQQQYIYEKCGCVNPYLWHARSVIQPDTDHRIVAPLCSTSNDCFQQASDTLFSSISLIESYCSDCSQECSMTSFSLQTSSSALHIEPQMNFIKAFVENSTVQLPANWSTAWRDYINANYLNIIVLRETHIVETNKQSASLGFVDVISNVGGQTGLWIGISFLSIMEFIEMVYRLIRYQIHSIRETIQKHKENKIRTM